jgi:hypothetical protein
MSTNKKTQIAFLSLHKDTFLEECNKMTLNCNENKQLKAYK